VATPGMSLQGRPQRLQLLPKQWLHRTSSRTRVTLLRTLRQSISLSLLFARRWQSLMAFSIRADVFSPSLRQAPARATRWHNTQQP
jgi:hypothetical protein